MLREAVRPRPVELHEIVARDDEEDRDTRSCHLSEAVLEGDAEALGEVREARHADALRTDLMIRIVPASTQIVEDDDSVLPLVQPALLELAALERQKCPADVPVDAVELISW